MTQKQTPSLRLLVSAIAFGLFANVTLAQDTSSSVTGKVTDADGNAVAGATVEILHVPSGTRKVIITDESGRYTTRGLRVGPGFEISVTKDGLDSVKESDVELRLGETGTVNLVMGQPEEETLGEVVVTGIRLGDAFDPNKMGAGSTVTREQIDNLPSINRSIEDYVRLDPRLVQVDKERGGISAAGQNNRYNNITIDGVSTNDEFGLNDSGLPALNQPISLDAIEELNINVASYDVTQSDFTGANINAVTKSGTNDIHGTVYAVYRNKSWFGDNLNNQGFTGFDNEKTYGFTLGGPILQDRLFFFLNYEEFERASPAPLLNRRLVNGIETQFVSDLDLQAIRDRASQLGYTLGSGELNGINNEDQKIIAKIDWNINDSHRAALRYGKTDGKILRTPDIGATSVSFSDHWYSDNIINENLTAQLYSDWSDVFSTELSLSRNEYSSIPQVAALAPQVTVRVNNGADQVVFGTERSRHSNVLDTKTSTGFLKGSYYAGDHTVSFGLDYKNNDVFNLFLQDTFGTYDFASVADFQAGRVNRFRSNFPATSTDINSVAADFALKSYGVFLQDNWVVNSNLTVNYGARIDIPDIADKPTLNPAALTAFGLPNDTTIDGNYVVQPRAGFNYTFDSELRTQLRGGLGLFSGSSPNVWLSNSFSNNGLLASGFDVRAVGTTPVPVTLSLDPRNQPRVAGTPPTPNVDIIDPNFEQPTTWKASLALERELPWMGLIASVEGIFTETDNNLLYRHLNLGTPTGILPDGRLSYWSSTTVASFLNPNTPAARVRQNSNRNFNNVLLLTNTSKGHSRVGTLSLTKPMEDNWYASLAYTYSDGEDVNPGTSAVALSNWSARIGVDPNDDKSSRSNYIFTDRISAVFTYKHFFFENLPTSFSMFYEGRSGRPFSYAFQGDVNGDSANQSNDLFYIPRPGEVIFRGAGNLAAGTTRIVNDPVVEAAFFNYINSVPYLRDNQGRIADRNAESSPWSSNIDVRLSQELPALWNVKGEVYVDILNFGNLIDKKFGQFEEVGFPLNIQVARFAGVQDGKYIYQFITPPNGATRRDQQSRWAAQLGVKFRF
jgi:hypothetical protein